MLRDARLREPGNPEIRYHLAKVLAQTGRKAEAKEELTQALKISRQFEGSKDAEQLLASNSASAATAIQIQSLEEAPQAPPAVSDASAS